MLPAQYRMTRSADFAVTVGRGMRAVQPDLVVHALRVPSGGAGAPKIGLVVSKSVGSSVQRHRVSRKLRHVARGIVDELNEGDRVVIRALPGSRLTPSPRLAEELRSALNRLGAPQGRRR